MVGGKLAQYLEDNPEKYAEYNKQVFEMVGIEQPED